MVALPEAAERAGPLLCLLHKPASSHLGQVHGQALQRSCMPCCFVVFVCPRSSHTRCTAGRLELRWGAAHLLQTLPGLMPLPSS